MKLQNSQKPKEKCRSRPKTAPEKDESQKMSVDNLSPLSTLTVVGELNDAFDIEIKPNDLIPRNFNSSEAMMELIEKLQNE